MDFKESIKCEPEKTQKEIEVDAYIEFINSQGQNFIEFIELLNECIGIAEQYELIGDVDIKARIKDFESSNRNTEKKALDDVFGVEIIPTTERDKEWIMLLTELVFKIKKSQGFDKKDNGYKAYNQMIDLKSKEEPYEFDNIKQIIENAKMKQRNSSDPEDISEVYKYPILKKQIKEGEDVEFSQLEKRAMFEIIKRINNFRDKIDFYKANAYMPIIEMQIKTKEIAELATRGSAKHYGYKAIKNKKLSIEEKEQLIKDYEERIIGLYKIGYIKRGINAPIMFERVNKKIKLQNFEDTLKKMYPILRTYIVQDRIETGFKKVREYNKHTAELLTVVPFLSKFISAKEGNLTDEAKTRIKLLMINTDIDNVDFQNPNIVKRRK